jgi:hypothetical protein
MGDLTPILYALNKRLKVQKYHQLEQEGKRVASPFSLAIETKLTPASTAKLETWGERVLDAPTLAAVFKDDSDLP